MDPQQKISLDPRLKEAYDSVMGNNVPLVVKPPLPSAPQEPPIIPLVSPMSGPQIIPEPPISFPQASPQTNPVTNPIIVAYHAANEKEKVVKKISLRWILLYLLSAAFLLGYAIICIKVFFNIEIPILSSLYF